MGSEEFRVSITGQIMSFFMFDAVTRPTDFEGLMFGDYQRCLHREISDQHDAEDQNRPATIVHDITIRRIIPTGAKFSFYDRRYNANMPKYAVELVNHLNAENQVKSKKTNRGQGEASAKAKTTSNNPDQTIIRSGFLGWFRYHKYSNDHTQSTGAICRALSTTDALRGFTTLKEDGKLIPDIGFANFDLSSYYPWPGNGPLYLFSFPSCKDNILAWDIELKAFVQEPERLRPLRMQVCNLGDTTHVDYWKLNKNGNAAGVENLLPNVLPTDFSDTMQGQTNAMVQNTRRLAFDAMKKLIDATNHMVHGWNRMQANARATGSMLLEAYVLYGCSPSQQDLDAMLEKLNTVIGANPPPRDDGSTQLVDVSENASISQASGADLFDDSSHVEIANWEDVDAEIEDDNDTDNFVHVDGDMLRSNDPENSIRRAKRPKENISSSSSGATSDDTSDPKMNAITERLRYTTATGQLTTPGSQERNAASGGSHKSSQQQRKKSKSSDSGSSAEINEVASPASETSSVSTASTIRSSSSQYPPQQQRYGLRGSPAATPSYPMPNKGRGERLNHELKTVAPPPGFSPKAT